MTKLIILMVAALLVFVEQMVQGQGVVTVSDSDPSEYANDELMALGDTAPFIHVDLTTSDSSVQTVYLTIQQNGIVSDAELFAGSVSNKLNGMQTTLGPFIVQSGQTNNVVISATINSIISATNMPVVSFNLTAASNSTHGSVQGAFPIVGGSYVIDTNALMLIEGKLTFESLTYYDNENGIYYLLIVTAKADPLRRYTLEHSLDMVSWDEWVKYIHPAGLTGDFQVSLFLDPTNFPSMGFFRLKSQ